MAQGQYTYRLDVENAAALRKLAQFAKASDKATQRIEKDVRSQKKSQQELGRQLRDLKLKYKDAQNAAVKFGKHDDNRAHIEGLRRIKRQIKETREEYAKARQSVQRFNAAQRNQRLAGMPGQYGRPIGPAAPMRGFRGNTGMRAAIGGGFASGLAGGGGGGLMGSAVAGGVAGVAAAVAGRAIQAIEDLARATAQYANDAAVAAAQTQKMQIALKGVTGAGFVDALADIRQVTKDYNVPLQDATKSFTRFAASAKASGVGAEDITASFRGLIAANKALGGSQEQANGILLAATQVFGKGKVSAEELRGQIGERLPGAVALFAESMGITTAMLDKRLEEGTVSVEDFVNFTKTLLLDFDAEAKNIGQSSAEAGQRLANELDELKRNIGNLLMPIGAVFQDVFGEIIKVINGAIRALNNFLGLGTEGAIAKTERELEDARQRYIANRGGGEGKGAFRRTTARSQALADMERLNKKLNELRGTGEGNIEQGTLVTGQDLINNRKGAGKDTAGQLARIAATDARRAAEARARENEKFDKQRFKLLEQLRRNDAKIAEAQLSGTQRAQLGILNTYQEQNRAVANEIASLDIAVDKAEAKLKAAQGQLAAAAPGSVDAARAAGLVERAQIGLTGAQDRRAQFGESAGDLRSDNLSMAIAQSTQGFRDRAEAAKTEASALRMRNRLAMEGLSDEEINRQLQLAEIEKERADALSQIKPNMEGAGDLIQSINDKADIAREAVNELTNAQIQASDALNQYISTSMDYLTNVRERIAEIASSIEQSISQSIMGVVNGTMTAAEAFHNFFKSVGQAFLQMAAQMIAKLIIINLLKTALGSMFGGGPMPSGVQMGDGGGTVMSGLGTKFGTLGPNFGIPQLATGGIVTKPTTALIGEGGMNEAVVPLPNGRSIPVDFGKNAGGGVTTNITVNVDQGGNATTETDADGASKLANAIDGAVKRVIMDERRVGGLLYNGRR